MHKLSQLKANRVGETDMRYQAIAEESGGAAIGTVKKLIGDHEVEGPVFFFQRADGAERDYPFDAELFEAVNVGAEIKLGWRDAMTLAVSRQKCDLLSGEVANDVGIGRVAPWRVDRDFLFRFKTGHGVQPAASNNSDGWFHSCISSSN